MSKCCGPVWPASVPAGRPRLRFAKKVSAALVDESVASLAQAKAMHDDLESIYNPHVDFVYPHRPGGRNRGGCGFGFRPEMRGSGLFPPGKSAFVSAQMVSSARMHDDLESIYNPHVDFGLVDKTAQDIWTEIQSLSTQAGRN